MNVCTKTGFDTIINVDGNGYQQDTKLKDMLNKAFDANIVMAWSRGKGVSKSKGVIGLDATKVVVLKSNGDYTTMTCSEWLIINY